MELDLSQYDEVSEAKLLPGFTFRDILGNGFTGPVLLDRATQTAIKIPWDQDDPQHTDGIEREERIYTRFTELGGHPGLLVYHGRVVQEGIVGLRLEYAPNYDVNSFLINKPERAGPETRLRWMVQLAQALDFVHGAGVIHGDVATHNIFLDDKLNAKLADFGGGSIDSLPLLHVVIPNNEYPGERQSVAGDIFAVGSVIYEVITGGKPYAELEDDEIGKRYARLEFPETTHLGRLGRIIRTCWECGYSSCAPLARDLQGQSRHGLYFLD